MAMGSPAARSRLLRAMPARVSADRRGSTGGGAGVRRWRVLARRGLPDLSRRVRSTELTTSYTGRVTTTVLFGASSMLGWSILRAGGAAEVTAFCNGVHAHAARRRSTRGIDLDDEPAVVAAVRARAAAARSSTAPACATSGRARSRRSSRTR